MASNHTSNYNLNQWEPEDKVIRTEFNEDNQKIDTALGELAANVGGKADQSDLEAVSSQLTSLSATVPKLAYGTYSGNNASSRTINVGFTPKVVFVFSAQGGTLSYYPPTYAYWGGMAFQGGGVYSKSGSPVLEIVSGGFKVSFMESGDHRIYSNLSGESYRYLAIG